MKATRLVIILLVLWILPMGLHADSLTVSSKIDNVTVYPELARIERVAKLDLTPGEHTVLFTGLPLGADIHSVRASAKGLEGMTLLGLSHTVEEHFETPRERVRALEEIVMEIDRDSVAVLRDHLELYAQQKALLQAMADGKLKPAAGEVGLGELDVNRFSSAFVFFRQQMADVMDSTRVLSQRLRDAEKLLKFHQNRLSQMKSQRARKTRTVEVDMRVEQAGQADIVLTYAMQGARWIPIYDARLDQRSGEVELTMYAEVTQSTGEDWTGVDMALSTARPSTGIDPGLLAPWVIGSVGAGRIAGRVVDRSTGAPIIGASVLVVNTQRGVQTDFHGEYTIQGVEPGRYTLRVSHLEYQSLEMPGVEVVGQMTTWRDLALVRKTGELEKTIRVTGRQDQLQIFETSNQATITKEPINLKAADVYTKLRHSGIVATYRVVRPETVPSGNSATRVAVGQWRFPANLERISRPSIVEGVFRIASLDNTTGAPLLAGTVNIFADSDYLGRSAIAGAIVEGADFSLPFGKDERIEVKRRVIDRKVDVDDDETKQKATVEITLRNIGSTPRSVRLEAAFPFSEDERVEVDIDDVEPEADEVDDKGVRAWEVTLYPGDDRKISYQYELEYPTNVAIRGL